MSVKSIGDYSFTPKDKVENFHGNMLVYMQWEKHLSFCAPLAFPLPPDMPFGDLVAGVLAPAYAVHPDSENVDFEKGEWQLNNVPFTPDFSKSLQENGLSHKSVIRVRTPALEGLAGADSAAG